MIISAPAVSADGAAPAVSDLAALVPGVLGRADGEADPVDRAVWEAGRAVSVASVALAEGRVGRADMEAPADNICTVASRGTDNTEDCNDTAWYHPLLFII